MSFCRFSTGYNMDDKTLVDNTFINEYLPKAPDMCVKVYLLGLSKCSCPDEGDNSLEYFARVLKICEEDVLSCFSYWEDLGLVAILSTNPVEIRYLKVNKSNVSIKKYQTDKYTSFNIQVQELFKKRMVMPNEYNEFYNLIEKHHIEQDALLRIIQYCIDFKGFNLSPNYCITVARDWERSGIHTLAQVEEKITELGVIDDKVSLILSAMGSKRKPQLEDKDLLNKWMNAYGFEENVILYVINSLKTKKRRLDINVLDSYLTKYFEMKLLSVSEIEAYENEKENMFFIATTVNKELGVFYEDLTKEIDLYVVGWVNMGYDIDTLKVIADSCFKSSVRTLEGFNNVVNRLFKLGIVSLNAYMQYLSDNLSMDEKIKEVLHEMNIDRNVVKTDRTFYSTWVDEWKFPHEVVLYGASLSREKSNSINYLNKILSNWNAAGTKTLSEVKVITPDSHSADTKAPAAQGQYIHNHYTKDQIASLIVPFSEIEV